MAAVAMPARISLRILVPAGLGGVWPMPADLTNAYGANEGDNSVFGTQVTDDRGPDKEVSTAAGYG